MLITMRNVEKDLGLEGTTKVDFHFLATTSDMEGFRKVYVFETDLETGKTYKILSFNREDGDYSTVYAKPRRQWRIRPRQFRYLVSHLCDESLVSTLDSEGRRSNRSVIIPTEMFRYITPNMDTKSSPLVKQQQEEYATWGFEYAYLKSLDHFVDLNEMEFTVYNTFIDAFDSASDEVDLYQLILALEQNQAMETEATDIIKY